MWTFLIIAVILFECIVLLFGIFFVIKYLKKLNKIDDRIQIKVNNKTIDSNIIRDGVKSAIQELDNERELEKTLRQKFKSPEHIYNSGPFDEIPVKKSGGNLVPYGLNDEDKAILEMFYND